MGKNRFEFTEIIDVKEDKMQTQESTLNYKESITREIDAIHEMTTKNYTTYQADALKASIYTWTDPYNKPVLTHHRSSEGVFSSAEDPIGRVIDARFKETSKAGPPVVRLTVKITEDEAIEKVEDGRYQTVSVGGSAGRAICSICGQDLVSEGFCEHRPGREYDGETAHLILKDLNFKEVSFVNVPADEYAQILEESSDQDSEENVVMMESIIEGFVMDEKATSFQDFSTAEKSREWDKAAAKKRMKKRASSDNSGDKDTIDWSTYREGFSWYNENEKEKFSSYKLPYADVVESNLKAVWEGVQSVMDAVNGTQGRVDIHEVDKKSVYNHMKKYYDKFDEEPPEYGGDESSNIKNSKGGYQMDPQEKIENLEEKLDTKKDRVSVLEQKVEKLEETKSSLDEELESVKEKKKNLEDKLELQESEIDELTEENEKLKEKQHKILAEKVVNMKLDMDKVKAEEQEEIMEEHVERTEDSLKDTLKDLERELERKEESSEMGEEVEDPGENLDENNVEQKGDSKELSKKEEKYLYN